MATVLATYYGNSVGPSSIRFRVVTQFRVTQTDPVKGYYLQRRYYVQVVSGQSSNFTSNLRVSWTSTRYALSSAGDYAVQSWQNVGWVKYGATASFDVNAYYVSNNNVTYKSEDSETYRVPYAVTFNYYSNYATEAYSGTLNAVGADKNVIVRTAVRLANDEMEDGLYNYVAEDATTYLGREGYKATGYWGTSKSGGTLIHQSKAFATAADCVKAFGKDLSKGNVTINLYAQWERIGYTVKYNANGGTKAPANQNKTHGESLKLTTAVPVRDGYVCIGWAKSSTATKVDYLPGATYTTDADITLYAVWRKEGQLFKNESGTIRQGRPALNGRTGIPYIYKNGTWKRGGA